MKHTFNKAAAVITAATMAMAFGSALPALAADDVTLNGDDTISFTNSGTVSNSTSAFAGTGLNFAGGSVGGHGGNAGEINNGGGGDVQDSSTGNGGAGGAGGVGGTVISGNAGAFAGSSNTLNYNDITVDRTGASSAAADDVEDNGDVAISGSNSGDIADETTAFAATGLNFTDGSVGGDGGTAGAINAGGSDDVENSHTGSGGAGGMGGAGGLVSSGEAHTESGAINVLNWNIVRVMR